MAEDNKKAMQEGAEIVQEPGTPTENKVAPDLPPWEEPSLDAADAPGDVVVPSNIIDGLFEEKRTAEKEAEKQAAEQGKTEPETPAAGE